MGSSEGVNIQYQADVYEVNNYIILHAASHCTRTVCSLFRSHDIPSKFSAIASRLCDKSTHPNFFFNLYVCCIIPSSLFTTIFFKVKNQCIYKSRERHFVVS